jgi:hypothetical protein
MTDRIPPAAWVLVAAALAIAAFTMISRGLIGRYVILPAEQLIPIAELATPFLVAAATVAGAGRWPAGRSRLLIAAALSALHGVLSFGRDTWFWWSTNNGPGVVGDLEQVLLIGGSTLIWFVGTGATLMLGLGLWSARFGDQAGGRRVAAIVLAALGLVAAAGSVWIPFFSSFPLALPWAVLTALVPMAVACLGIAAVRSLPSAHRLPEILIATGAAVFMAAMAWSQWFMNWTRLEDIPPEWVDVTILLPRAGMVAGFLIIAVGFASSRLFPIRPTTG